MIDLDALYDDAMPSDPAVLRARLNEVTAERDARWAQVQEQATALRVVALWLGGPHHSEHPDDVAALARAKGAELDALRALIEGRTTPPTDAELAAHEADGGEWLLAEEGDGRVFYTSKFAQGHRTIYGADTLSHDADGFRRIRVGRWVALRNGLPCAWPEVKP